MPGALCVYFLEHIKNGVVSQQPQVWFRTDSTAQQHNSSVYKFVKAEASVSIGHNEVVTDFLPQQSSLLVSSWVLMRPQVIFIY